MKDVQAVLDKLQTSEFRRSIKLGVKESEYLKSKGLETVLDHAADFVETPNPPMTANKRRGAIIRFSWRSMQQQHVAADVSQNGTTFPKGLI